MSHPSSTTPLRCLTVWLLTTAVTVLLLTLAHPALLEARDALGRSGAAHEFDTVLVGACALAGALCLLWLWLVATIVVLGAARGRSQQVRGVPDRVRRALLALCGIALVAAPLTPTHATPNSDGQQQPASSIAGLPLPDRAEGGRAHESRPAPRAPAATATASPGPILVRPGDSLWSIAVRLAPSSSPAAIAALTQQLHRVNREAIGADPDLILPGQRLSPPDANTTDHHTPR